MFIEAQPDLLEFHLSLTIFGDVSIKFMFRFRGYNVELSPPQLIKKLT